MCSERFGNLPKAAQLASGGAQTWSRVCVTQPSILYHRICLCTASHRAGSPKPELFLSLPTDQEETAAGGVQEEGDGREVGGPHGETQDV